MPHEIMTVAQVARYLKLMPEEVTKLAARGQLPSHKAGGRLQFRKGEVDHWVEARMGDLSQQRMREIEHGVSAHHGLDPHAELVVPLIPAGGAIVPLAARTRDAAIRALVEAADAAGLVYDRNDLVAEVRHREEICPTTLAPQVALPHPRHPLPYDIADSFVIVGLARSGIPFGAPDGTLTRLFFLISCKDDRTHLHVLARIARILDEKTTEELLESPDAPTLTDILRRREDAVIAAGR